MTSLNRRRGSNDIVEEYTKSALSNVFHYVLLCEFSSIFHPSNRLQALDMCERLKVRNCGYISLYRVNINNNPRSCVVIYRICVAQVKHFYMSCKSGEERYSNVPSRRERNPMVRGFSQEVAMPEGGSSPRIPKLHLCDRTLCYDIEESQENDRNPIFDEFE
uniref:Ras-associating domain-containing protein n=1 Tax=Syphacia muris TaxID=451379 RepID=A0A0N5B168_9BILA